MVESETEAKTTTDNADKTQETSEKSSTEDKETPKEENEQTTKEATKDETSTKMEVEEEAKPETTTTTTTTETTTKEEDKVESKVVDNEETTKKPEEVVVEKPVEEEEEESEWEEDGGEIEVEEFYVKYKNLSYLHCEWKSRDELIYSDKRIDQKIKRYKLKKQQMAQMYDWDEEQNADGYNNDYDELFNSDYVEIDRILDEYEMDDTAKPGTKVRYFLVKWKSLPYEDASWELENDVKNAKKIERFRQFNTMVPEIHQRINPRPKPDK